MLPSLPMLLALPVLAPLPPLPGWHAALLLAPVAIFLLIAAVSDPSRAGGTPWRAARYATTIALACAAAAFGTVVAGHSALGFQLRGDKVGSVGGLLVTFIAWVIVRHSASYLAREPGTARYLRWLMTALAAVMLVLITNHVLVLMLAWMTSSFAVHQLITFFNQRPQAAVAAHKKFLVARSADVCMLAAAALLVRAFGTLHIDQIAAQAARVPQLDPSAHVAMVLVTLAVLLKSAQLPFHGWLIQVMEAPTPVSALLHAGIVNLGGIVLLRFAPLVSAAPIAQTLLVTVGAFTAVVAALVMATRISVKVGLAWSTCAQMGFMLLQCGLGAWDMALVHLVAHSLYKAHAFLTSGGTVRRALIAGLGARAKPPRPWAVGAGVLIGTSLTLLAAVLWQQQVATEPIPHVMWLLGSIVALALAPFTYEHTRKFGFWRSCALYATAATVPLLYFALHSVAARWLQTPPPTPPDALLLIVAVAFSLLFLVQSLLAMSPNGALARRLYPWFYGGLFLDEYISRYTFRLWPPPAGRVPGVRLNKNGNGWVTQ